jgi:hypothetical protein
VLSNGAPIDNLVEVTPTATDLVVNAGETFRGPYEFLVQNNRGNALRSPFSYRLRIDNDTITGQGTAIAGGGAVVIERDIVYSQPIDETLSIVGGIEVCIAHPDMVGERCDIANLIVRAPVSQCVNGTDDDGDSLTDAVDPGCHTGGVCTGGSCESSDPSYDPLDNTEPNPVISVQPSVVRQGGTTTVTWDPNGMPGCSLTPPPLFSGVDGSVAGSVAIAVSVTTLVGIDCGFGPADTAEIRVIPNIFET